MRILLLLLGMLLLTGCDSVPESAGSSLEPSLYGEHQENGVTEPADPSMDTEADPPAGVVRMWTEYAEYPVGTKEITLLYEYTGTEGTSVGFGPYYWDLEIYEDGKWRQLPVNGVQTTPDLGGKLGNIPDDEYVMAASSWTYDLSVYDHGYGPGRYRILKEFGDVMYAAEFAITDTEDGE